MYTAAAVFTGRVAPGKRNTTIWENLGNAGKVKTKLVGGELGSAGTGIGLVRQGLLGRITANMNAVVPLSKLLVGFELQRFSVTSDQLWVLHQKRAWIRHY